MMEKSEPGDAERGIGDKPSSLNAASDTDPTGSGGKEAIEPSSTDVKYDAEPPNGGLQAWLQVVASFFLFFNTWGLVNTFGAFQTFYSTQLLSSSTPSAISWIGSIQAFLLLIIGVFTGPIFDAGYLRTLVALGSFLIVFGMMMTSLCTAYWQVMLAQAVVCGLGCGCLFVPSVAIVSTYFTTRKSFATGIGVSGSSLGGVIYPIMFHKLEPKIGFGWTTRVMAFIMLATLLVPVAIMKMRDVPKNKRALVDLTALREAPFTLFSLGCFFVFMGLYIPMFYVQTYAIEEGIVSAELAFYLLVLINTASVFGRVIPNFIADLIGPFNVLIPCVLSSAILAFSWIGIKNTPGLIIFCLLYGLFTGGIVSLPPTVIVGLSPSLAVVGSRMGTSFAFLGFALLIGTPIAGAIVKPANYTGMIGFCGAVVAFGSIFIILARFAHTGYKFRVVA